MTEADRAETIAVVAQRIDPHAFVFPLPDNEAAKAMRAQRRFRATAKAEFIVAYVLSRAGFED